MSTRVGIELYFHVPRSARLRTSQTPLLGSTSFRLVSYCLAPLGCPRRKSPPDPSPCPEAVDFLCFSQSRARQCSTFCSLGPQDRENRQPLSRERASAPGARG